MKDETKHTPGPWKAHGLAIYAPTRRKSFGGPARDYFAPVCTVDAVDSGVDEEFITSDLSGGFTKARLPGWAEAEANARVIAATPELLDACEVALEFIFKECGRSMQTLLTMDKLKNAIAKANGGVP